MFSREWKKCSRQSEPSPRRLSNRFRRAINCRLLKRPLRIAADWAPFRAQSSSGWNPSAISKTVRPRFFICSSWRFGSFVPFRKRICSDLSLRSGGNAVRYAAAAMTSSNAWGICLRYTAFCFRSLLANCSTCTSTKPSPLKARCNILIRRSVSSASACLLSLKSWTKLSSQNCTMAASPFLRSRSIAWAWRAALYL